MREDMFMAQRYSHLVGGVGFIVNAIATLITLLNSPAYIAKGDITGIRLAYIVALAGGVLMLYFLFGQLCFAKNNLVRIGGLIAGIGYLGVLCSTVMFLGGYYEAMASMQGVFMVAAFAYMGGIAMLCIKYIMIFSKKVAAVIICLVTLFGFAVSICGLLVGDILYSACFGALLIYFFLTDAQC